MSNPAPALTYCRECTALCRALSGTDFLLAPRYGDMLNVVAIAFVFCSAMPLLLPIIALAALLVYWTHLAELLIIAKRPAAQVRRAFLWAGRLQSSWHAPPRVQRGDSSACMVHCASVCSTAWGHCS